MAATIKIWSQDDNKYYNVLVDIYASVLDNNGTNMEVDYYLKITTNMRIRTGNTYTDFPEYVVRQITDVPAGYAPTNFTELVNDYIDYFITYSETGWSSSSSSSSSSQSSSSSSSSSSEDYSSSSSSSSSP